MVTSDVLRAGIPQLPVSRPFFGDWSPAAISNSESDIRNDDKEAASRHSRHAKSLF
jgi:hypothetical protein